MWLGIWRLHFAFFGTNYREDVEKTVLCTWVKGDKKLLEELFFVPGHMLGRTAER